MLELANISKSYGEDFSLANISFKLKSSQALALTGASGSGKSTILKIIKGLIKPDSGSVIWTGSGMSYVFQKGLLFPHMTVAENIGIAIKFNRERVSQLLDFVCLDPAIYADRHIHELSGGQAQRVSLAQALAIDPQLLLLDEPFNGLDQESKEIVMARLLDLKNTKNKSIILVSHDSSETSFLTDLEYKLGANHA